MLIVDSLLIFQHFSIQYSAHKTYLVRNCDMFKSNCCSVSFECFCRLHDKKSNGMTSVVSYMNQNSSYRVNFDRGKRNLVRVSGEFQLSVFVLTELK